MKPVPNKHDYPGAEEQILEYWNKIDAFRETLRRSLKELKEGKRKLYSFYDGPPFATGLPHYGHILAGTIKDTVTRYAHMTGHHVDRRFGWDCHGLPIEFEIDKQEGVRTKQDVLKMGIDVYNEKCRAIVMRYSREWEKIVKRLGRWIDFERDYKTMDKNFMESVWWVFKQLYDKGLVYRGFKVMPYSTACTTPLSNFEANLLYKDVNDPSIIVSFPLVSDPQVALLAWTTTPWTLPSNVALCVNPSLTYVTIQDKATDKKYILCESRLIELYPHIDKKDDKTKEEFVILERRLGKELEGLRYMPLFDYYSQHPHFGKVGFRVVCDEYVTDSSGTGVVHQAPAYGEDDYRVCLAYGIIKEPSGTSTSVEVPAPVDDNGRFIAPVTDWLGLYVKDADPLIIEKIKQKGRLVRRSQITHSYPFCWRSETPLLYRAVPSWFVRVTAIKQQLLANNQQTYWVPEFVKERRFHNWLLDARDWAISRNRYWGTPLPIWMSDDGEEIEVIGSVAELSERSGVKNIPDLHRHYIDKITLPSKKGKGVLKRVEEVFDCWFESGSMPYAQQHYPFENREVFEQSFPADFIAEGIDQTRGWFYTLLVISTALFNKPPFKNLIVNGLVLAADGKKMSKRLKNYPDPQDIIDQYGADALRLYLIDSPVVRGDSLKFEEKGVKSIINDVFNRWFNAYRLLVQNILRVQKETKCPFVPLKNVQQQTSNILDLWVLASTQSLLQFVRQEMAAYRLYTVVPRLIRFVNQLANCYVRLNRDRLKGKEGLQQQLISLSILFDVLLTLCRAMAPFAPFFTDFVYQNLKHVLPASEREESVHFLSWPEPNTALLNPQIEEAVQRMMTAIELARNCRNNRRIPNKYPLNELVVIIKDQKALDSLKPLENYILSEANVKKLTLKSDTTGFVKTRAEPDHKRLGTRLRKDKPKVDHAIQSLTEAQLLQFERDGKMTLEGHELTLEDVRIVHVYGGDKTHWEADTSSGETSMLVALDIVITPELKAEGIAREVINRIQMLRKAADLEPSDPVVVFYKLSAPENTKAEPINKVAAEEVMQALKIHREFIEQRTGTPLLPDTPDYHHPLYLRLAESSALINFNTVPFTLTMTTVNVALNLSALKSKYGPDVATDLYAAVLALNYQKTKQILETTGKLNLKFNNRLVTLELDKDIFLSPAGLRKFLEK
jgi:isoleucyl-tRNA synthetase